uniref:WD_REPEATS_REGION domain-containing protein n=1 Tax=Steinernema glaseri TaxID=37863 RepID=A0A1I8AMT8_9BILA
MAATPTLSVTMKKEVTDLAEVKKVEVFYTGGTLKWSYDGKIVFTTCANVIKALRIEDADTSYMVGDVSVVDLKVSSFGLSNDGKQIVVAYTNGLLQQYTLPVTEKEPRRREVVDNFEGFGAVRTEDVGLQPTIKRQWKSTHTSPIQVVCFSPSDDSIITGSSDGGIKVWDAKGSFCTYSVGSGPGIVSCIEFIDDLTFFVGYASGTVRLYNIKKKKTLQEWKNHNSQISAIFVNSRDEKLASIVSRDQTMSIVNYQSGAKVKTVPLFEAIESAIPHGAKGLVTIGEQGKVKVFDRHTGKMLQIKTVFSKSGTAIMYNEVEHAFLCASNDENLCIIDADTLSIRKQLAGFNDEIFSVALIADGKFIAAGANSPELRVYDRQSWECYLVEGHSDTIMSTTAAPFNSNVVATCSKDASIIIWKYEPDNTTARDCGLKKIAMATGHDKMIAMATGHDKMVTDVVFSRSHKNPFIVSVSDDMMVKLWSLKEVFDSNVTKGEELLKLTADSTLMAHSKEVTCVDISPNDKLCVTGSMEKVAKLWHINTEKMQLGIAGSLHGHRRGVWSAKFSPNSQNIVTGSGDCTIKIFSISDLTCIQSLSGHESAVLKVAFVNNGHQLVSGDGDGLLKVWSLDNSECTKTIDAHYSKLWGLEVLDTPETTQIVSAGADGRIIVWEDVSDQRRAEEEQRVAERMVNEQKLSNLMQQERYGEALAFALTLTRPYHALKIINKMIDLQSDDLQKVIFGLDDDQIAILLDFTSQWNTNSRNCHAGQTCLNYILRSKTPEEILELPNINTIIKSLVSYSNRHYERLSNVRESCAFLRYTLSRVSLLGSE